MKINYFLILSAFYDDEDINKYCDPEYADKDVKILVNSIYNKLQDYDRLGNSAFYDLNIDGERLGFMFTHGNLLVSFGVNKKFRTAEKLQKVFDYIKSKFDGDFESFMWARNTRAINWLKRCGMVKEKSNIDNVIKLKYICQ